MRRIALVTIFFLGFGLALLMGLPRTLPKERKKVWVQQVFSKRLPNSLEIGAGDFSLWPAMKFEATKIRGLPLAFRDSRLKVEWVYFDVLRGDFSPKVSWEVKVPAELSTELFLERSLQWFTRSARNLGAFEFRAYRAQQEPFVRLLGKLNSDQKGDFRGELRFPVLEAFSLGSVEGRLQVRGEWVRDLSRLKLSWTADATDLSWAWNGLHHLQGSPAKVVGELTTDRGEMNLARVEVEAWAGKTTLQRTKESEWWMDASDIEAAQLVENVEGGILHAAGILNHLRIEFEDLRTQMLQKAVGKITLNEGILQELSLKGESTKSGQLELSKSVEHEELIHLKLKEASLNLWTEDRLQGVFDLMATLSLPTTQWKDLISLEDLPFKGQVQVRQLHSGALQLERFVTESWRAVPLKKKGETWPVVELQPWEVDTLSAEVERTVTSPSQIAFKQIRGVPGRNKGIPFEGFLVLDLEQETVSGSLTLDDRFNLLKWGDLSQKIHRPIGFELNIACKWDAPCASIGKGKDQLARMLH